MPIQTGLIDELFIYNDWATAKLLDLAASLTEAQLDQPFAMGEGSLRKTLSHLWGAEEVWLNRWQNGRDRPGVEKDLPSMSIPELRAAFQKMSAARREFLASRGDAPLSDNLTYVNFLNQTHTHELGHMLLHVGNHGVHHRAQASNMIKRLGGDTIKPGLDYIFMKLEQSGGGERPVSLPALDVKSLRAYFAYSDWARRQVHAAAVVLSDEQLDREFPMGVGTLRKTLLHIRFAEQWWLENWMNGPGRPFPELDNRTSLRELDALFDQTATSRNAFIESLQGDVGRMVEAHPRPGVVRRFPVGCVMLQLCCHGTHHRAQALNMLRHVGGAVPGLDVLLMVRAGVPL